MKIFFQTMKSKFVEWVMAEPDHQLMTDWDVEYDDSGLCEVMTDIIDPPGSKSDQYLDWTN